MLRRAGRARVVVMMTTLGLASACSGGDPYGSAEAGAEEILSQAEGLRGNALEAFLGKLVFEDTQLSSPAGQSCATCHDLKLAFTDPDQAVPTSAGVVDGRFGMRNSPMAAYASFVPPLSYDADEGLFSGGLFLDGRVSSLEEQAAKPFLSPLEMNNADEAAVVRKLKRRPYVKIRLVPGGPGQALARGAARTRAIQRPRQRQLLRLSPQRRRGRRHAADVHGFHLRQHRRAEEPGQPLLRARRRAEP